MRGFAEALRKRPRNIAALVLLVSLTIFQLIVLINTQTTPSRATHFNPPASPSPKDGTRRFWRPVSPTRDSRTFQGDVQRTGNYGP